MKSDQIKEGFEIAKTLGELTTDELLGAVGLQRKVTLLARLVPTFGAFAAGMTIGAGVGMMMAPMSGDELRRRVSQRAEEALGRKGAEESARQNVEPSAQSDGAPASGEGEPRSEAESEVRA